jgi:hypothetical protein
MKVPVRHKGCGGLLGFYHGEIGEDMSAFISETFTFVDGNHPKMNDEVKLPCPDCDAIIQYVWQMDRCFEEVVL